MHLISVKRLKRTKYRLQNGVTQPMASYFSRLRDMKLHVPRNLEDILRNTYNIAYQNLPSDRRHPAGSGGSPRRSARQATCVRGSEIHTTAG
jgi:hypothetical protein